MSTYKRKRELLPPWDMPSDPVKAVAWFMHWLVKVLVRFFWLPILIMVILEVYLNGRVRLLDGVVDGVITFFVGLVVWAALYGVLLIFNVSMNVSRTISEVSRVQQGPYARRPFSPFAEPEPDGKVVEGTITDLEEERKKRRRE